MQIAVETAYERTVGQALTTLVEATPTKVDENVDLGLSLIEVAVNPRTVPRLRTSLWREEQREPDEDSVLVQRWLYQHLKERYSGFAPTLGRNRPLEHVSLNHKTGAGSPKPIDLGWSYHLDDMSGRNTVSQHSETYVHGLSTTAPIELKNGFPPRDRPLGHGVHVGLVDTALFGNRWLDGGFRAQHHSLWSSVSFPDPVPFTAGHATFATGLILQHAPGAVVEIQAVADASGISDSWSVAKALVELSRSGADVLNVSLGCFTEDNQPPLLLSKAVEFVTARSMLIAPAGNVIEAGSPSRVYWPAAFGSVRAVGALSQDGFKASFSTDADWVDDWALGANVVSTYFDDSVSVQIPTSSTLQRCGTSGLASWSGTSIAAAWATGAVTARFH